MTFHITECFSALIILGSSAFIKTPEGLQPMTTLTLPANAQEGCRDHHSQDHGPAGFLEAGTQLWAWVDHVLDLGGKLQTLAGVRCSLRVLGPYQAA